MIPSKQVAQKNFERFLPLIIFVSFCAMIYPQMLSFNKLFFEHNQYVLPNGVLEVGEILKETNAPDYALSPGILNEGLPYLLKVVQAWPVKYEVKSLFTFFLNSETIPKNCNQISKKTEIYFAECK